MNPNEPIKESEFIFRRLGESFPQFLDDLGAAVPLWLVVPTVLLVLARLGYARYYRRTRGPSKPDARQFWLGWAAILSTALLAGWFLIAFYKADTATTKTGATTLTALAESNAALWYTFVGVVFGLGAVFVVLMYVRDARSVRWYWAVLLAALRISVYAILGFVFLLPARQTWERSTKESRVIILLDISASMTRRSDDIATAKRRKTRMEYLIEYLTDKDVNLIRDLVRANPVYVYTFGTRLDEAPRVMKRDPEGTAPVWGPAEWQALAEYDFRPFLREGLSAEDLQALENTTQPVEWSGPQLKAAARPDGQPSDDSRRDEPRRGPEDWAEWASRWIAHRAEWAARKAKAEAERRDFNEKLVKGISEAGNQILADNLERLERRIAVAQSIASGTNVPDSVTAALNRESPNMVQGVIVLSDMRSNLGSDSSYRELRETAMKAKIPVFTVVVGEDRQATSIVITDVQSADDMPPDEGGKVLVEADGYNLAGRSVPVYLDVWLPGKDPATSPPDYTFEDSRADKTRGSKTPYLIEFGPGDPPHGSVEFVIEPGRLAADPDPRARALVTESTDAAFKKPVLKSGRWNVRARIPRDENEAFRGEFHMRERKDGFEVIQKKLRVLAVAGAPTREFQFLRTFLSREVQENRATLTVLVQNEAGLSGTLTPNATEQVLRRFPTRLDITDRPTTPEEKPYNLNEYDVIVAFDPDWSEITQQQAEDIRTWVTRQGGGLILVADRINTVQLARVERPRPGEEPRGESQRLLPILEVLPVEPDDYIVVRLRSIPRTPRRLYLRPMPGSDLLKIDDPPEPAGPDDGKKAAVDPIAGWERFFTDRPSYVRHPDEKVELYPRRGFFSCYPVKDVKAGAHVLAEFADIDERGAGRNLPWLVVSNPSAAFRTCFLGSGEVYRLYAYDKNYYERFWAKLLKYMAGKRSSKAASRGRVIVSKEVISGSPIRVQVQLLDPGSKPYKDGEIDPKFSIVRTAADGSKTTQGPFPLTATGVDGYFKGTVVADAKLFPPDDSEYQVVVEVPDGPAPPLTGKFQITRSDLEMDVTKPDLTAWLALASDFDDAFQTRLPDRVKNTLAARLPRENGMPKLAFKLSERDLVGLIPECFRTEERRFDIRGPVNDLWDKGVDLPQRKDDGNFWERNVPEAWSGKTLPVSWVLLVVVSLLSLEWLTRKLLRLA
jgi:hypothetical protein